MVGETLPIRMTKVTGMVTPNMLQRTRRLSAAQVPGCGAARPLIKLKKVEQAISARRYAALPFCWAQCEMGQMRQLRISDNLTYALICTVLLSTGCESSGEKIFLSKFDAVQLGSLESEAFGALGPARDSGPRFHLSQPAGFEKEYREASASGSVRYHSWLIGTDTTCTIGINAQGRAAYKACGGT
jgi:hypothetical protein